jgi:carboxylesterase
VDQEFEVIEGAEEFAFGEGPVGALLVHGFTGSPQGLRALGEHLASQGMAVSGPRLPGHGTAWEDLGARRSDEWLGATEAAYEALRGRCEEVFLVGLSFGAALTLDLAARRPGEISGVVALAPFVMSKDPRRFLAPVIRLVVQSLPGVGNDIADPDMREIVYDRVPLRAAASMLQYTGKVRSELGNVTSPLLIIHSRNDHTAHPANAELIHKSVSSADKRIEWLERSYHVITIDYDRDRVRDLTTDFIKERAKHAL